MLKEEKRHLEREAGLERVLFCLYDDASYRVFESAFASL